MWMIACAPWLSRSRGCHSACRNTRPRARQQRTLERELGSHQDALRKTQSKAHEVKTNKEYSAILAEIALGKQRLEALEDQLLALMEATDQQRQASRVQEQC